MEVIVKNNASGLIHPILTALVDKKWKHFVYRALIRRFLIAFVYLLIFLITTVLDNTKSKSVIVIKNNIISEKKQKHIFRLIMKMQQPLMNLLNKIVHFFVKLVILLY